MVKMITTWKATSSSLLVNTTSGAARAAGRDAVIAHISRARPRALSKYSRRMSHPPGPALPRRAPILQLLQLLHLKWRRILTNPDYALPGITFITSVPDQSHGAGGGKAPAIAWSTCGPTLVSAFLETTASSLTTR